MRRAQCHEPWLHGVEHLTCHQGYVYWKGRVVEHWSGHRLYSTEGQQQAAEEIARRCRIMEARGEVPSIHSVMWDWEDD